MSNAARPMHPGVFIRNNVIPKGLSVTSAAEKLGVTRPALSNLLNGKASLSQTMASRLEKVFGGKKEELMALQREYDHSFDEEEATKLVVSTYAPTFLDIRARNIEDWAGTLDARAQLPALVRRLVHTTGASLSKADFSAYDNSQRPGWDGITECSAANAWVPAGFAGWEFGCNADPQAKANADYVARCKLPPSQRLESVFVFVTPRNWPNKDKWIAQRRAEKKWKDVRAYDANDLEQWLENSPSAQVWLANILGIPTQECQPLSGYWNVWASVADPAISPSIFESIIASNTKALEEWLRGDHNSPLVISAASKEEGLAFLSAVVQTSENFEVLGQQAIIFRTADAVRRLKGITSPVIPVIYSGDLEEAVLEVFPSSKVIIVADKNLLPSKNAIEIGLPSYEAFRKAITEMELDEGKYASEIRGSGRSPTILRRLLAKTPALAKPNWAQNVEHARWMVPFVLIGRWKWQNEADREIIRSLAGEEIDVIEQRIIELSNLLEPPLLREGEVGGVASKLESLKAVASVLRAKDIKEFLLMAEYVLEEDDPSLDLEKSERWSASIYGKVREHSNTIRKSICDTLILLSVHGPHLLDRQLNISVATDVAELVKKLLKDRNPRVWQSQQNDLPSYAEAAPEVFLSIVEEELAKPHPAFECLFEPAESGLFTRCDRTGMLWALELMAWKPDRLSRVINALGALCRYRLDDNWANKPAGSIRDILLSWYPHTKATLEQRIEVLEGLWRQYPEIAWSFCVSQLGFGGDTTSGTCVPKWRDDAGEQEVCTVQDTVKFRRKCFDLLLSRSVYDREKLEKLVDLLDSVSEDDRDRINKLILNWLETNPAQSEIAKLREHVRTNTMTSIARQRQKHTGHFVDGHKLYALLEPADLLQRNRWLFDKAWVAYSGDELDVDELDHDARDRWVAEQRTKALKEILEDKGYSGIIELCSFSEAPQIIGWTLRREVLTPDELVTFLSEALIHQNEAAQANLEQCVSGALSQFDAEKLPEFLQKISENLKRLDPEFDILRLHKLAPPCRENWNMVSDLGMQAEKSYWQSVTPGWLGDNDLNYCVRQLLEVDRPSAAFAISRFKLKKANTKLLQKILYDLGTKETEPTEKITHQSYEIVEAMNVLNGRDDADFSKLVQLEFMYSRAIGRGNGYEFPNISMEIATSPHSFFQLIALCFVRDDEGEDDASLNLPTDIEQRQNAARLAYNVLDNVTRIPGTQDDGTVNADQLKDWVGSVRDLARMHRRAAICDQKIGALLRLSGADEDGRWPSTPIRQVIEELASEELATGFEIAVRNDRGAHWRPNPDNGSPEREIAVKYRGYAEAVMNQTPFVGKMLLRIAESYEYDAKFHDNIGRSRERFPE